MNHSFNTEVAIEVGVEAAIIFENILFWVQKNQANGENVRDGSSWVYNSRAAWGELFPYLGEKQIRNALERLLAADLVSRDTFSFGSVNRTYWYTLAERAKAYLPKGPNVGSGQKGQTKTDINNPINSTDIPSVSPKPKPKASTRERLPAIRLSQFLEDTGGLPPCEWGDYPHDEHQWDTLRIQSVWRNFERYWSSPDCPKPLKRDWYSTWQNWCDREAENGRRGGGTGGAAGGGLAAAIGSFVARGEGNGNANGHAGVSTGSGTGQNAGNDGRSFDGTEIPF